MRTTPTIGGYTRGAADGVGPDGADRYGAGNNYGGFGNGTSAPATADAEL